MLHVYKAIFVEITSVSLFPTVWQILKVIFSETMVSKKGVTEIIR